MLLEANNNTANSRICSGEDKRSLSVVFRIDYNRYSNTTRPFFSKQRKKKNRTMNRVIKALFLVSIIFPEPTNSPTNATNLTV